MHASVPSLIGRLCCMIHGMIRQAGSVGLQRKKIKAEILIACNSSILDLARTHADFFTDSFVLFHNVLNAPPDCASKITDLVTVWLASWAIATLVSTIALWIKVKLFRDQFRRRQYEFLLGEEEHQTARVKNLAKHRKRLVKIQRQILTVYAGMLVGIAECVPLGILQARSVNACIWLHTYVADHLLAKVRQAYHDVPALARDHMAHAGIASVSMQLE